MAAMSPLGSCRSQVSCVGQRLCAVVADTREHAKRAAAAVKITYEDLPDPIFTVEVRDDEMANVIFSATGSAFFF